jgi:DNA-directed RNA polymerase subunit RPC12/RpoP
MKPSFGIPYASTKQDAKKRWYCECPVCGEKILLKKRKDFESFTKEEYGRHYADKHGGRQLGCAECDKNILDGGHYAENCPKKGS